MLFGNIASKTDACRAIKTRVGLFVDLPRAVGVRGDMVGALVRFRDWQALSVDIARDALAWVAVGEEGWSRSESAGCYPRYRGGNVLCLLRVKET